MNKNIVIHVCVLVFLMLNKNSLFSDFLWLIPIKCTCTGTLYVRVRGLGHNLLIDVRKQTNIHLSIIYILI